VLDTRVRGVAFLLGAAVGAAGASPLGRLLRSAASSAGIVALGVLGILAVLAPPHSSFWQDGGALASPVLAALAVTLAAPKPSRRPLPSGATAGETATEGDPWRGLDPWAVLVTVLLVHGPVLALASPARTHLPWAAARLLGLVLVVLASVAVAAAASRLDESAAAAERRRVLLPPAFVAAVLLLLSATGAFHWEQTRPLTPQEIETRSSQGNEPG
jgi:peptidoglycan/LPS O-acetylase OafA/YrhL